MRSHSDALRVCLLGFGVCVAVRCLTRRTRCIAAWSAALQAEKFKEKGNELWGKKQYLQAIEQYTFAVECDPNNHVYYTNRAACYASMEEWEKCLRDATRAVEKKPDWVKGWFRKGQALFELKKYEEAHEAYSKAYSFEPKPDFKAKADEAERMWKKDLSKAGLAKAEGNSFFKDGKIQQAVEAYTRGIDSAVESEKELKAALYNNRAHCWVQLYEPKKVVDDCSKCLEFEPNNIKALLRRATASESLEKIRSAFNDFQQVVSLDPSNQLAQKGAARLRATLRSQGKEV